MIDFFVVNRNTKYAHCQPSRIAVRSKMGNWPMSFTGLKHKKNCLQPLYCHLPSYLLWNNAHKILNCTTLSDISKTPEFTLILIFGPLNNVSSQWDHKEFHTTLETAINCQDVSMTKTMCNICKSIVGKSSVLHPALSHHPKPPFHVMQPYKWRLTARVPARTRTVTVSPPFHFKTTQLFVCVTCIMMHWCQEDTVAM